MGKQAYMKEERRTVAGGPYYTAASVVSSAPHHAVGTFRDMLASATLIKDAGKFAPRSQLVADAAAATGGGIGDPGSTKHDPENIERLRTKGESVIAHEQAALDTFAEIFTPTAD